MTALTQALPGAEDALLRMLQPQQGRHCTVRDPAATARWAAEMQSRVARLSDPLRRILEGYTTRPNVEDELARVDVLLHMIAAAPDAFDGAVPRGVGFMPRNQLLYSLFYMGLVPARMTEAFHLRPPRCAFGRVTRMLELLGGDETLSLFDGGYDRFVQTHVRGSDVVIFTGSSETASRVAKQLTSEELLLASGSGHNPVVIGANADLDDAARRVVRLCLYNQGQDCAAPSAILIPATRAAALYRRIVERLEEIRVRDATRPLWSREVGPNTDDRHPAQVRRWFSEMRGKVVFGGRVNEQERMIEPTVLVAPLSEGPLYREWFAPVIPIQPFDSEAQLAGYFNHPDYRRQSMYLTLLGRTALPTTEHAPETILIDTDLHEHERGDRPYGGHGEDASFLAFRGRRIPTPILPQREIARLIAARRRRDPEQERRRGRRTQMAELGIASYRPDGVVAARAASLTRRFARLNGGESSGQVAQVAGRVVAIRNGGRFVDLEDGTGKVQLYVEQDRASSLYWEVFKTLDLGDQLAAGGTIRRTPRGTLTLDVQSGRLLAKALTPPQHEHHAGPKRQQRRERLLERMRMRRGLEELGFVEADPDALWTLIADGVADRLFTRDQGRIRVFAAYTTTKQLSETLGGWAVTRVERLEIDPELDSPIDRSLRERGFPPTACATINP